MAEKCSKYTQMKEEYVREALKNDMGVTNAADLTWYLEDFTNKGDNFTCDVTSVQVYWSENNERKHKSYVAKLARPIPDLEVFQEVIEQANAKEAKVLLEMIPKLNECLESCDYEALKVPQAFFCHPDPKTYVLIMEDLRSKRFQLFDRKKGMDVNHAVLVIKELAKLHASSKLLEHYNLSTIDKLFSYLEEPFQKILEADNHPFMKYYENFVRTHVDGAIKILRSTNGYESSVKWLEEHLNIGGKTILKLLQPSSSVNCLNHGDCWSNNIMFRYNSKGIPVDVRLVDFQGARRSSPACDITYFSYLSLSPTTRLCHMENLLRLYYTDFTAITSRVNKKAPFSFTDLESEMVDKEPLGILFGINRLPLLMADEEAVPVLSDLFKDSCQHRSWQQMQILNRNRDYKERFLSLFNTIRSGDCLQTV